MLHRASVLHFFVSTCRLRVVVVGHNLAIWVDSSSRRTEEAPSLGEGSIGWQSGYGNPIPFMCRRSLLPVGSAHRHKAVLLAAQLDFELISRLEVEKVGMGLADQPIAVELHLGHIVHAAA